VICVNSKTIEAGDVVRIRSGGPLMVADSVAIHETPFVRCVWFDERNRFHDAKIRSAALELAQRPPP
jgi:uncharacterized protein YodC (DUF2158 family)